MPWTCTFPNPGRVTLFTVYFLATEVTNIGQNLFLLANKAELFGKGKDMYIGLVWTLTFFVVRVLPVPYILYAYVATHVLTPGGCNYSAGEYATSLLTVPIPICLNLFWFYKIVSKAMRMLGKQKKEK